MKNWLRRMALKALFPVDSSRGWIPIVSEQTIGAFQTHTSTNLTTNLTHPTVYACVSQIAGDIGKLRLNVTKRDAAGIAKVTEHSTISPLLRKPNGYQNRLKFIEMWLISLLTYGNTYVIKARNASGAVVEMHILDPNKVEPLVSENGDVFYKLKEDRISKVPYDIEAVPAYEIIHDTMATLYHPLIGVPPLYAGGLAAQQGLAMQEHSTRFFENRAQPGGVLTTPGHIKKETADAIREAWASRFTGDNTGKIAVLTDGLKYDPLTQNASDSQFIEQLKWSDEKICSVFKVPPYKVHVGEMPTYEQSETLDRKYYSDCLQRLIESIELLLDDGLRVPPGYGTHFDLDDLMRMDLALKMKTAAEGVKGGIMAPNEARRKFDLSPVKGGQTPYLQQQNYSLSALNDRDKTNPLAVNNAPPPAQDDDEDEAQKFLLELRMKESIV